MSGDFNVAKVPHSVYTPADELEADQAARVRQKAEEWHAAYCKDQAAGECLRLEHLGEKDGFIAGYETAERDGQAGMAA